MILYLLSNLVGTIIFFIYQRYLTIGELIGCFFFGFAFGGAAIIELILGCNKLPNFNKVIIGKKKDE